MTKYTAEQVKDMSELIVRALQEPNLIAALSFVAVWDTERAIEQARRNNFESWETCTRFLFTEVVNAWNARDGDIECPRTPMCTLTTVEPERLQHRTVERRASVAEEREGPAARKAHKSPVVSFWRSVCKCATHGHTFERERALRGTIEYKELL